MKMKKIFVIILFLGSIGIGCIEEKREEISADNMSNGSINITDTEKPKEIDVENDMINETLISGGESKEEPITEPNETLIPGGGAKEEPGEINISGETGGSIEFQIAKKGDRSNYAKSSPDLVIITNGQEWNNANLISEFNIEDFQNDILIVTLLGQKPNSGYQLDIREIIKSGNTLEIFVDVNDPEGGIDVITSPYIITKVKKDDVKNIKKFVLFMNGEKIIERNKEI